MQSFPKSLKDIAAIIGTEKTFEIVEKFGGQKINIPSRLHDRWVLLPLLGNDLGLKLISLCGKTQIVIPLCRKQKLEHRNEQIRRDRLVLSSNELVSKYGLSLRMIQMICSTR